MIEVIDNVAYLRNITDKAQSKEMWEYLKSNPNQKLYIIKGQYDYGCGTNGELVPFTAMWTEKKSGAFCISDFYKPQENVVLKPLEVATQPETIAEDIIPKEDVLSPMEPIETDIKPEEDKIDYKKLYENELNLHFSCSKDRERLEHLIDKNNETIAKLEQERNDLQSALFAMKEKRVTLDEVIEFVRNGEGMEFKVTSKD